MKKFLLAILLAVITIATYSQQPKKMTYLKMWLQRTSEARKGVYFIIRAETGIAPAPELKRLVDLERNWNIRKPEMFYEAQVDSVKMIYNCFPSPTAAMEYLGNYGWELVTVIDDVSMDNKTVKDYTENITAIVPTMTTNNTYFYFKKEIR